MHSIRRPDFIIAIVLTATLALIIGCGGGGGGGSAGGTSATATGTGSGTATGGTTSTTSTTSTTGSTTSTTGSTTSTTGSTTSTTGSTTSTTGSTTSTTGSTTSTTTGGSGGFQPDRVYYVNGLGPSGYQIRSIQPNGSDDQLLVAYAKTIPAAVPNPAGNKFAFFSQTSGGTTPKYDLFTNTTPNATGATRLTTQNFLYTGTIQYTPDGSQIVFTATTTEGDFRLYRINANGTSLTNMTSAEEAAVSPDGTTILYSQFQATASDLFKVPIGGGSATRLTNTSADERNPQWSKDGTFVVFSTDLDGNYNIYRMSASGGSQVQVTSHGLDEFGPSLNQDGTQVSFTIIDPLNGLDDQGLYRCNLDGSSRSTLKLGNIQTYSYWSPGSSAPTSRSWGGFGMFGGGTHRPPIARVLDRYYGFRP